MNLFTKTLLAAACCAVLTPQASAEALDPMAENVTRTVKSSSMMGPLSTMILYHFQEQNLILEVTIDNKNTKFPVMPRLHVFSQDATPESVGIWVKNLRGCALEIGAANPEKTVPLHEASCVVKSHTADGETDGRNGKFTKYKVEFEIKDLPAHGDVKFKNFTDTETVYVKVQAG